MFQVFVITSIFTNSTNLCYVEVESVHIVSSTFLYLAMEAVKKPVAYFDSNSYMSRFEKEKNQCDKI
jgi:hypothetical protein